MGWTLLARWCQMVRWPQNQTFFCQCFAQELNSDTSSAPTSCVLVWFSLRNVMTDCTIVQHSSRRAELEPPAISSKTSECQYIVNCDKLRNSIC